MRNIIYLTLLLPLTMFLLNCGPVNNDLNTEISTSDDTAANIIDQNNNQDTNLNLNEESADSFHFYRFGYPYYYRYFYPFYSSYFYPYYRLFYPYYRFYYPFYRFAYPYFRFRF